NSLDVNGRLNIRIQQTQDDNITWVGYIEDPRRAGDDDIGALYYVVAVILIYGLSIVMMIASHIRKNKQDNQLRTYLKEMAKLRKNDRREKVLSKINDISRSHLQHEAKQKLQQKVKDAAPESEANTEAFQPLMTKETTEDTADVSLQPYCCISAESHSPSSSECQNSDHRGINRSLSHLEGTRRKSSDFQLAGTQDCKTLRLQEKRSTNFSDHKSVISPVERRRASINDFHLSPLYGRQRSLTDHELQHHRFTKPRYSLPIDPKIHQIKTHNMKHTNQRGERKPSLPTSFHVVNEDAVL
ncbi:unnamed protein product, partial [Candidula unifasciata]